MLIVLKLKVTRCKGRAFYLSSIKEYADTNPCLFQLWECLRFLLAAQRLFVFVQRQLRRRLRVVWISWALETQNESYYSRDTHHFSIMVVERKKRVDIRPCVVYGGIGKSWMYIVFNKDYNEQKWVLYPVDFSKKVLGILDVQKVIINNKVSLFIIDVQTSDKNTYPKQSALDYNLGIGINKCICHSNTFHSIVNLGMRSIS